MSMVDRICMVTGATSGIGAAVALELARQGAIVIGVGRDPRKCEQHTRRIQREIPGAKVSYLLADLSSRAEIRNLSQEFNSRWDKLDVLVNNAGGYFRNRQISVDGLEMTFALNHLGYFLLTMLLLDKLKASSSGRVINVSSSDHLHGTIDFSDLKAEKSYDRYAAYARSKLANLLFTYELARRLEGTSVTANAVHPGSVKTNLGANNGRLRKMVSTILDTHRITPAEGARTILYLATSADTQDVSGRYFSNQEEIRSSGASYDRQLAKQLWEVSEHLTGLASTKQRPDGAAGY